MFATTVPDSDVAEGCAPTDSGLDLLRFTVRTVNIGTADLLLGDPMCPLPCSDHPDQVCGNPDFICSPDAGHNHPHFLNYALYELLDGDGQTVVTGHKQAYCLEDEGCSDAKFVCSYQGLTVGCFDTYQSTVGCQYVNVTDVPSGDYVLRVTVDPLNLLPDSNRENNVVTVAVTIPDRPPGDPNPPRAPTQTGSGGGGLAITCVGDCEGTGGVTISDILLMVNIALGDETVAACPAGDPNHSGVISVDDILAAVNEALGGCPSP